MEVFVLTVAVFPKILHVFIINKGTMSNFSKKKKKKHFN